jgi:pheromone shutdown protein TraB
VAGEQLLYWIAATGGLTAVGALCALAHPFVLLSSFVVSPITTLSPVIGAGHVLALLQAYWAPPVVREFERVADEIGSPACWWSNRLLRIFLVFLFTTFGALAGNYVGLAEMFATLF